MPDLRARVSDEEHNAAMAFAEAHGVTLSSLGVALCRWLGSGETPGPEVERCMDAIVAQAAEVDAENRRRRPEEPA